MKRTFHLFSVAVVLTFVISLVQVTAAPAKTQAGGIPPTPTQVGDWGPTPTQVNDPGPTPTQVGDPGPTPTPLLPPGPTWTPFSPPGPTSTPLLPPGPTETPLLPPGPTLTPFSPPGPTWTPQVPPMSVPAVLSIARADRNPTNASSVNFIVVFSEPVIDVDAGDFTVSSAGWIKGAAVSYVNGSGNVYTVTVNAGKGTGTLRLDVPVNATVTSLTGTPLGALPFQRGEVYFIWRGWR